MTPETLNAAIAEAARFIAKARLAQATYKDDYPCYGGKETGAAKRASMDLTRALADLRRPA